jgi:hypothetical protein
MGKPRSRRLRLLESLRKTINEKLHQRVWSKAALNGAPNPPENTSAIYLSAKQVAPDLLDQLFAVHVRACEEQGVPPRPTGPNENEDHQRKQMLSAVRAAVMRSQTRFG